MGKYNIRNVSGQNVNIGDNNIINMGVSEIQFFEEEAESFFIYNAEQQYYIADAHQPFDAKLKNALSEFSLREQEIFLNYLNKRLIDYIEEYKNKRGFDSENLKTLQKMQLLTGRKIKSPLISVVQETSFQKTTVFISYSQVNRSYLNELKRHFKPIENKVRLWDDSHIKPGQKWKDEIETAMNHAKVAILFLSGDFFNSQFITTSEIPVLLTKAMNDGTTILNVFLTPFAYENYPSIMQYQGVNSPDKPISSLSKNNREKIWVELIRRIQTLLSVR